MPVQPLSESLIASARYSSASRPTADALIRSGRSLETRVTSHPSLARLRATARIRVSLSPSRKPDGSESGSVWLSSTRMVPPSSPTGTGSSSRPWMIRSSSSMRSAVRAKKPSSGWCRLPSSSVITTTGRTTSCSCEPLQRPRVGQQDAGVEHVGAIRRAWSGVVGGRRSAGTSWPWSARWSPLTGPRRHSRPVLQFTQTDRDGPEGRSAGLRTHARDRLSCCAVVNPHERASQYGELPHSPLLRKYAGAATPTRPTRPNVG